MYKFHLVKRETESWPVRLAVYMLSVVLAFLLVATFLKASGKSPLEVYQQMLLMSLGTKYALSETMVKAIPLMLAGLAVSFAFRVKLWNIGAEGQLYMGALASSYVALFWSEEHSACTILPLMLIAAFIFAGLWGLIAGIFKAYWNVNETIVTLLMNYIAIFGVDYLVYGSWKDPANMGFPLTPRFSEAATLPTLGATRIHMGLLIALVIALLFFLLLRYSRWGYELRVLGDSPAAARYAGIDVRKNILMVMFISAGVAGIAGMIEVSGITHRLQTGFSPGYGYTAIIVAWLAHLHPLLIILVAFLFGALLVGGFGVQSSNIPFSTLLVLQGAVLFFLLAGEFFTRYRIKRIKEG